MFLLDGEPLVPELGFEGALFVLNLIITFSQDGLIGSRYGSLPGARNRRSRVLQRDGRDGIKSAGKKMHEDRVCRRRSMLGMVQHPVIRRGGRPRSPKALEEEEADDRRECPQVGRGEKQPRVANQRQNRHTFHVGRRREEAGQD